MAATMTTQNRIIKYSLHKYSPALKDIAEGMDRKGSYKRANRKLRLIDATKDGSEIRITAEVLEEWQAEE